MKVRLTFEYEILPEDGVGTRYDAMSVAVHKMRWLLEQADSNDDVAAVFSEIEFRSEPDLRGFR
jgi:hypothetical protein